MVMDDLRIGLIGGGFIGRVHSIAFRMLQGAFAERAQGVSLKVLAEKDAQTAERAAARLGIHEWMGNWRELAERMDLELVIVALPNYLHKDVVLELIGRGKNVLCEKPLAMNAKDARQLFDAAQKARIKHGVNFNYRKTPAVLLVKSWIENGDLGSPLFFRSSFSQDWALDKGRPLDWHFQQRYAGSGALGDIGTHVIDMARFLVGEITSVVGSLSTHTKERAVTGFDDAARVPRDLEHGGTRLGTVDVDDTSSVLLRFRNGAQGSMLASRVAQGRKNHLEFELYGTEGSVLFDWERPNEVYLSSTRGTTAQSGFSRILVGGLGHPYGASLCPVAGMGTGFEEPFAIQLLEMIEAIRNDGDMSPSFYDGWRANQVVDAVLASAAAGKWCQVEQ
jgi:predicted dehydrogenase